jgi:predicted dehydrogenase
MATPAFAIGKASSISVGLIGCGGRGPAVAEAMARVSGVTISHVCDPVAASFDF